MAHPLRELFDLRVELLDTFWDSFLSLDESAATFSALMELLFEATTHPESAPTVRGTRLRVMVTTPESGLPRLRLFFFIEDGAIQIMFVDECDDFEV